MLHATLQPEKVSLDDHPGGEVTKMQNITPILLPKFTRYRARDFVFFRLAEGEKQKKTPFWDHVTRSGECVT